MDLTARQVNRRSLIDKNVHFDCWRSRKIARQSRHHREALAANRIAYLTPAAKEPTAGDKFVDQDFDIATFRPSHSGERTNFSATDKLDLSLIGVKTHSNPCLISVQSVANKTLLRQSEVSDE
jgi:hypothetical protein